MDRELFGLLFLAFLPGMVIVIAGTVSAVRKYGVVVLWCLRFVPVREKLTGLIREMHPREPVAAEPQDSVKY